MAIREFDFEREPTVSIVKKILTDAIKMKVTDIHFDPHPDKLVIRFRNNGELSEGTLSHRPDATCQVSCNGELSKGVVWSFVL